MVLALVFLLAQTLPNLIDERPDPSEFVEIDGAKEPHRVPEWATWRMTFRSLNDDQRRLPADLHLVVSPTETSLIFRAVTDSLENDAALQKRGMELYQQLLAVRQACDAKHTEPQQRKSCFLREGNAVSGGWREEEIAFRLRTLDIRDRLFQQLEEGGKGEVKLALIAWAEARKAKYKATIHKPDLAHYFKPR
jgi:hypothetical protein